MPRDASLFGADGPLESRTKINELGRIVNVRGAQCKCCKDDERSPGSSYTTRTELVTYLGHVSGLPGDPGGKWSRCPKQEDCGSEEQRIEWRALFIEMSDAQKIKRAALAHAAACAGRARQGRQSTVSSLTSDNDTLGSTPPPPPGHPPLDLGPGFTGTSLLTMTAGNTAKPVFTATHCTTLVKLICMMCFEGNIAPFCLSRNMSFKLSPGINKHDKENSEPEVPF